MKLRKHLVAFMRGWLPKEFSLPSHQRIKMIDHFMRLHFLRLAYGITLAALFFMPFGVYHSRVEPYITGYLWGYNLPIGYLGLLLGIAAVLYPKLNKLRSVRFSSFTPFIGLFLLLSFFFSPKDYFINLIHGTNFSSVQIDVDFAVGNPAVLGLSILSIAFGLVSFFRGWLPRELSVSSDQGTIMVEISEEDRQRKIFQIMRVASAIMVGTFLGLHHLINPFNENIELTAISWTIFIFSLISVNFLLYKYSKKTNSQMAKLQQ